jgi:hypothetical protein
VATRTADVAENPHWATTCLNCRRGLHGPFCAHCGQRARPPHPTLAELTADSYAELVGWDGKVLRTLRMLIVQPGEATRRMLDGERARFIPPLRLYLLCSVVYFVVAAGTATSDLSELQFEAGVSVGQAAETRTPGSDALLKAFAEGLESLSPEERRLSEAEIARQPRFFQPLLRALATDYPGLQRRILEMLPRALFILIPVLAAILGAFYRRRRYVDHLYFALHFQTVVFLAQTVATLFEYGAPLPAQAIAQVAAVAAILVHGVLAQRRVYGGTWPVAILKAAGTGALYAALWVAASLVITLWVTRSF